MNNPYQTPAAAPLAADDTPYSPEFFSLSGRLGRLRYLGYCFGIALLGYIGIAISVFLMMVVFGEDAGMVLAIIVGIAVYVAILVFTIGYMVRRLHDLDHSGWFSLLILVPIVNLLLALYLLFAPGKPHANRFGPPPAANTTGVVLLVVIPGLLMIITLFAIAIPQYAHYVERSQSMEMQLNR